MKSENWRNATAPRALFEMMKYKPSNVATRIKAPVFLCYGKKDLEIPGDILKEIEEKLINCESKIYSVAHFDFYRKNIRETITKDQIAFFHRVLSANKK